MPDFEPPPPPKRAPAEREERRELYRQGVVVIQGGEKIAVIIKNLSARGARVETRERLVLSDEVVLSEVTLNLRRRAKVVWHRDGTAGLKFIEG